MFDTGLVSVTFREKSVQEIVKSVSECGMKYIEWGSDIHAPYHDSERLQTIVELQKQYGISCCSYGTYFRLGKDSLEELPEYIRAAKVLGTNVLRLWAGKKSSNQWTQEEKEVFYEECRKAAKIAEESDVIFCLECHRNTLTEEGAAALELMKAVNSPAFKMYWQPNPDESVENNVAYARMIAEYTVNIHAFHIKGYTPFPLEEGIDEWLQYLPAFNGDHLILLEFMPDKNPDRLEIQANSLRKIINMLN